MLTNPLDPKLALVLKSFLANPAKHPRRDKVRAEFREIRRRTIDAKLVGILDSLFEEHSSPTSSSPTPTFDEVAATLSELRSRAFSDSAAILFCHWKTVLAERDLQSILPVTPDAYCLETWRKTSGLSEKDLESQLLTQAIDSYATVGADWVLTHSKPEQSLIIWEYILGRKERPRHLPTWSISAAAALAEDTRGNLLEYLLRHTWPDNAALKTLGEVIRFDQALLKQTFEVMPAILCKKNATVTCVRLLEELIGPLDSTEGAEREFITVSLARLGTGILLGDCKGETATSALDLIGQSVNRLRNPTQDQATKSRTWILENLGQRTKGPDGNAHVTKEGAYHLSLAFEMVSHGLTAKDVLTATAQNLGLTPLSRKGEAILFNPRNHQDLDGGMLPGDDAVIEEPGWLLGKELIARAKVRRGGQHVRINPVH